MLKPVYPTKDPQGPLFKSSNFVMFALRQLSWPIVMTPP